MKKKTSKRLLGKQPKEVAEKTKERIIKTSLKVFAQEGFNNAKLRDIAAQAGTTHSLIRHHFGSKEDLWMAVVDYGLKLHEDRLKRIIESGQCTDPVELFKTIIRSHVFFTAQNPEITKVLLHDNSKASRHLDYIVEKEKGIHDIVEPHFREVQELEYFKGFDHRSFTIYLRAISETPIAISELANKSLEQDILSESGIALHAQRVIDFLFGRDK
ncbi:MAG: TetR/AcrR family transcriptional regulator [Desulfobacteraceae bacterium]|nr:TetR/AcrR family transcriptional regulator [Desulfobacteraceae bacterium]